MDSNTAESPNHHADHPGFSGFLGALGAASMLIGRGRIDAMARRLVDLSPDDCVVDIGCGPGSAACAAAALGAEVVGVDPAPVMLRFARMRDPRRRVQFIEGAAEALPLEDGCATAVWSLASVHHWPDVVAGLVETRRVLRSGGRFVAIERRITDRGATGLASHGWTTAQATRFAEMCSDAGFEEPEVALDDAHRGALIGVVARSR